MCRDIGAFGIGAETPAVIAATQPVLVHKTVLKAHAAMDALILPDVTGTVLSAPDDPFLAKQASRRDSASAKRCRSAYRIPAVFRKQVGHIRFTGMNLISCVFCHSVIGKPTASGSRAGYCTRASLNASFAYTG